MNLLPRTRFERSSLLAGLRIVKKRFLYALVISLSCGSLLRTNPPGVREQAVLKTLRWSCTDGRTSLCRSECNSRSAWCGVSHRIDPETVTTVLRLREVPHCRTPAGIRKPLIWRANLRVGAAGLETTRNPRGIRCTTRSALHKRCNRQRIATSKHSSKSGRGCRQNDGIVSSQSRWHRDAYNACE